MKALDRIPMVSKWYDYNELSNKVICERGFTFSALDGYIEEGYAVALEKSREKIIPKSELNGRASIVKVLQDYAEAFNKELSNPEVCFGAWVTDKGDLYLDVVVVVDDLSEAKLIASHFDQIAVYHLNMKKVLLIGGGEGL